MKYLTFTAMGTICNAAHPSTIISYESKTDRKDIISQC